MKTIARLSDAGFQRSRLDFAEKAVFDFVQPALRYVFFELYQLVAVQVSENVVIAGADGVNQVIFHGLRTIPCFAGGDGVNVQLRAVAGVTLRLIW